MLNSYEISFFKLDNENRLWCHTGRGFFVYTEEKGLICDFTERKEFEGKIFGKNREIFFDKNNRAWLPYSNGFLIINMKKNLFRRFLADGGISFRGILAINDSLLLLATYKGTLIFNKNTGVHKKIKSKWSFPFGVTRKGNSIWLGFPGNKVGKVDIADSDFRLNILIGEKNDVYLIPFNSSRNKLWIGLQKGGLAFLNEKEDSIIHFEQFNSFEALKTGEIRSFFENSEGIWITTTNGVFLLDHQKGITAHYDLLPGDVINQIYEDKEGIFWLSTKYSGLVKWNRTQTGQNKTVSVLPEISANEVYAVIEDSLGYFWLPTSYGLLRYDRKTNTTNTYYVEDGLTDNEFNHTAWYKDDSGVLFLGGVNGMVAFIPEELDELMIPKESVFLTKLNIQNKSTGEFEDKTNEFIQTGKISIFPYQRSFTLNFSLLDYEQLVRKYAYKIEGFDDEWQYLNEGFVNINHLPYGNFTLKFKGLGQYGQWSKEFVTSIEVVRPFYLQIWFIVLVIIIIGFASFFIIRKRINTLENQKLLLKVEVEKQTKEIREQSSELKKTNEVKDKLMAIMGHELKGAFAGFYDISESLDYLIQKRQFERVGQVGSLINERLFHINHLLDNLLKWGIMQTGIIPVEPENINAKEKTEKIVGFLSGMAKSKNINLSAIVESGFNIFMDETAFFIILHNLIFNAIKFTENEGEIKIRAFEENDYKVVEVKDSGIGMTKGQINALFSATEAFRSTRGTQNESGTGLGINLCIQLARLNNGKIIFESEPGKGTSVKLIIFSAHETSHNHL